MRYEARVRSAKDIAAIFEVVKDIVQDHLGIDQAGLLVGISDLGSYGNGFIGAYYTPAANTIVINKRPLIRLTQTRPDLYNFYIFHVMLHEYIHSIGCYDEHDTRGLVAEISRHYFGEHHTVTQLATNMEAYLPELTYPATDFEPEDVAIEFLLGIDRRNTTYIN
jgi:hypothetical protein